MMMYYMTPKLRTTFARIIHSPRFCLTIDDVEAVSSITRLNATLSVTTSRGLRHIAGKKTQAAQSARRKKIS